jgi:hypothetical protein
MKKFSKISFLSIFLLFSVSLHSQTVNNKQLLRGIDALYNFEFEKSRKIFEGIILHNPDHPVGYHFKSIEHLWYYLDNKNEFEFESFLSLSDSVIKKCKIILEADSIDPNSYYLLGSTYSCRAIAYARAEEYLNTLWATKEFYTNLSKTVKLDSLFYDAYLGLGLFNFAVSQTPPAWEWALDLTGISGDKKLGLQYITLAAEHGKFSKYEAKFYLSQLQSEFFQQYNEAGKQIKSLIRKYPHNLLFAYTLSNIQVKEYKLKAAVKTLEGINSSGDTLFTQIKNYSKLSLGDIHFILNDFDLAKEFYEQFLSEVNDNHFRGIAAFRLGLCFAFTNLPDSANYYYSISSEGHKDIDEDNFARVKGQQYYENPPDSIQLQLIRFSNFLKTGGFQAAIDSIEQLSPFIISDTLTAESSLYLSEAYYRLGKYQTALDRAVSLISNENCEEWIKPFACYYAALSSKELGRLIDAELFIEYANNYSDYFYESKLHNLLQSLSYQLEGK